MSVEAILLGLAQDGGVPQVGCECERCDAARTDSKEHHWVACLGLVDYDTGRSWLIDATPDFREQLHALYDMALDCPLAGRDLSQIPHPFVTDTADLNHSNPLCRPGPERDWLAARGIRVGSFGDRWRLDCW